MKLKTNPLHKARQQGFILVIALVFMVVIAIGAIAAIRLSGVDELMNSNTRSRILASEAANSALIYCRTQVLRNRSSVNVLSTGLDNDEGVAWKNTASWSGSDINSLSSGFDEYSQKPMCMIEDIKEFMRANTENSDWKVAAYRITARGYSPNFASEGGVQVKGSQVWVQVVVGRTLE